MQGTAIIWWTDFSGGEGDGSGDTEPSPSPLSPKNKCYRAVDSSEIDSSFFRANYKDACGRGRNKGKIPRQKQEEITDAETRGKHLTSTGGTDTIILTDNLSVEP